MDGLLVNSEELYWKANIQASKEYNLGIPDDSYLTLVGASVKSMDDFYANILLVTRFAAPLSKGPMTWSGNGPMRAS